MSGSESRGLEDTRHTHTSSGLRDHYSELFNYSELFTWMAALNF